LKQHLSSQISQLTSESGLWKVRCHWYQVAWWGRASSSYSLSTGRCGCWWSRVVGICWSCCCRYPCQ